MIFFNIKGWVSSLLSILVFFQIVILSRIFFSKWSQVYFRHSIKSFPVSKFYGMTFYFKPFNYCQICKETHSNRNNLIEKQSTHLRPCLQNCKIRFFSQFCSLYLAIFRRIMKVPIPSIKYWKHSQKLGLTSTLKLYFSMQFF